MKDRLLKVGDVAKVSGFHLMTVYRKSREGTIPGRVKLGTAIRFRESAIREWLRGAEQTEERSDP